MSSIRVVWRLASHDIGVATLAPRAGVVKTLGATSVGPRYGASMPVMLLMSEAKEVLVPRRAHSLL